MELCIVEQEADAPAGLLEEWARERGHAVTILRAVELGAGPWPDPTRFDAVAPLGAEQSVARSDDPWIAPQVAFLREAHERGVPVLGLCFGGQALAAALGGAVGTRPEPEIGWLDLEPPTAAGSRPALVRVARGRLHAAARRRRSSRGRACCPHAFRVGRSIGLQFHPEVTPEIVDGWIRDGRATLAARADRRRRHPRSDPRRRRRAPRAGPSRCSTRIAAAWTDGRRTTVQSGGAD